MATLYELAETERSLLDLLESDTIDEQTLTDTLEGLDIGGKLEDYCRVIRQLEADSKDFKAEADFFTAKQKRAENGVKRLKSGILNYLAKTGKNKANAGLFTVSTRASKAVNVYDESKLPPRFLIEQAPKIDKTGIRQALNSGEQVDGAEIRINISLAIK